MNSGNSSSNPFIFSILSFIISFPPRRGQCLFPNTAPSVGDEDAVPVFGFFTIHHGWGRDKNRISQGVSSMNIFDKSNRKVGRRNWYDTSFLFTPDPIHGFLFENNLKSGLS